MPKGVRRSKTDIKISNLQQEVNQLAIDIKTMEADIKLKTKEKDLKEKLLELYKGAE